MAVRAALTDAELFISYNMPEKALEPLLAALPKAPKDLRLNQRLASLHTRAGRFAEAAVSARAHRRAFITTPDILKKPSRYGELAAKYENRATAAAAPAESEVPFTPVFSPTLESSLESGISRGSTLAPIDPPAPTPAPAKAAGLFWHAPAVVPQKPVEEPAKPRKSRAPPAAKSNAEIDLSEEWDVEVSDAVPAAAAPTPAKGLVPKPVADSRTAIAETVEEVSFYLAQSMVDQAKAGIRQLEKMKADPATVQELRRQDGSGRRENPNPREKESLALDEIEIISDLDTPPIPLDKPHAATAGLNEYVSGLGSFRPEPTARPLVPHAEAAMQPADGLDDLVADLETSLGDSFLGESGSPGLDIKPTPAPIRTAGSAPLPQPQP